MTWIFSLKDSPAADAERPRRRFQNARGAGVSERARSCLPVWRGRPRGFYFEAGISATGVLVPKSQLAVWQSADDRAQGSAGASCRFELVNEGRSPVHIIEVLSGCGCAKPTLDRTLVMPGAAAIVSISASVLPFVQRDVPIEIHTDSPIQPNLVLTFRIVGIRKPPFLFQVSGVPAFLEDASPGGGHEIIVETVESAGETKSPELRSSFDFLRFKELGVDTEPDRPGAVLRRRRFVMSLAGPPPSGTSVGLVTVTDPWESASSQKFNIVVRPPRADLTASPSLVTMGSVAGNEASILVSTREASDDLDVVIEGPSDCPFVVDRKRVGESGKLHRIRLSAGRSVAQQSPGDFRLRISASFSTVPLFVRVHIPSD